MAKRTRIWVWFVTHEPRLRRVDGDGFLIRDAIESVHSREKAPDNPPQLVVTFG